MLSGDQILLCSVWMRMMMQIKVLDGNKSSQGVICLYYSDENDGLCAMHFTQTLEVCSQLIVTSASFVLYYILEKN